MFLRQRKGASEDFPCSLVVRLHLLMHGGEGSIPGPEAKIPLASRSKNQNIKQKQYYKKFNKGFLKGPHQKRKERKKEKEPIKKIQKME